MHVYQVLVLKCRLWGFHYFPITNCVVNNTTGHVSWSILEHSFFRMSSWTWTYILTAVQTAKLFFKEVPIYTPTSTVWECPFLHIFTNNTHCQTFQFFSDRWKWKSHFNLHFFNCNKRYFPISIRIALWTDFNYFSLWLHLFSLWSGRGLYMSGN